MLYLIHTIWWFDICILHCKMNSTIKLSLTAIISHSCICVCVSVCEMPQYFEYHSWKAFKRGWLCRLLSLYCISPLFNAHCPLRLTMLCCHLLFSGAKSQWPSDSGPRVCLYLVLQTLFLDFTHPKFWVFCLFVCLLSATSKL